MCLHEFVQTLQLMGDRHSTSSPDSEAESSVQNESNPPQASEGTSLQSIPTNGHTLELLGQQSQATAATATVATPTAATPTATPIATPQHNTILQRAVSCVILLILYQELHVEGDHGIDDN